MRVCATRFKLSFCSAASACCSAAESRMARPAGPDADTEFSCAVSALASCVTDSRKR
jgi:hypothetical protein